MVRELILSSMPSGTDNSDRLNRPSARVPTADSAGKPLPLAAPSDGLGNGLRGIP